MKLGVDIYSLRYQGWDAFEHLEYAARIGLDVVHFSDPDPFDDLDDADLRRVRDRAAALGLAIEAGMGSIFPSSTTFDATRGPVVEQVRRMLRIAQELGSPVLRCFLGANADRHTATPLNEHIAGVIATCRSVRELALDLGIKLAIENHAGDLQGRELAALIREAGPEYVGACIDPGNSVWANEDPMVTLDYLAPYVVTSHVRDSSVWPHPSGAAAQWVAIGDGNIGIADWIRAYQSRCPHAPMTLEVITGNPPRILNYIDAEYWKAFPETPAWEFARFERLVRQGQPFLGPMLTVARGDMPSEYLAALAVQQRIDLERSVAFCRSLGIGERDA
jgi:sugar phosphate isomerase/epimerase